MERVILPLLFVLCCTYSYPQVVINEFMLSNDSIVVCKEGNSPDWIELYNTGPTTINLKNFGLSDDLSQPYKWQFPRIKIHPGKHLLILCSAMNKKSKNEIHTNFKLSSKGEPIVLTNSDGTRLDYISPISLASNTSYGRQVDGGNTFERMQNSTPGTTNNQHPRILSSHQSGFYSSPINLELSSITEDSIYYTTNGDDPTMFSHHYKSPLILSTLLHQSNSISNINTGNEWKSPNKDNYKAHVIKYASFRHGIRNSQVYHSTFFIDSNATHKYAPFEILSIVLPAESLFDHESGIYVRGSNYNGKKPVWTGNYFKKGKDWERQAHISFFDTSGTAKFEQNVGIRTHGGKSRNQPQKTLRIYARDQYGAPYINYPILDNKDTRIFKRFLLRGSMSCWNKTIIKDECTSYICRGLNLEYQDSNPVVVFINGEYWGIQSIREYFDENYFSQTYHLEKDSINIALHGSGNHPKHPLDWGTVAGNNQAHIKLYQYLKDHDLSLDSNYEHIQTVLDINSIIDYYCTEIYFNNKDWPTNNNKLWSYGKDGKWKQMLYDMDAGWAYLGVNYNALKRALAIRGSRQNSPYATLLFRKLVESPKFVDSFTARMACLMNTDFSADTIIPVINSFKEKYQSGIQEHINRWHQPASISQWKGSINQMIQFAKSRKKYVTEHISKQFNMTFIPENYSCSSDERRLFNYSISPDTSHLVNITHSFSNNNITYELYDALGNLLKTDSLAPENQICIPFPNGLYLIRLTDGIETDAQRINLQQ